MDIHSCDIIYLTETWLSDYMYCNSLTDMGFQMYRKDRTSGSGGGVAIMVRDSIASSQVEFDHPTDSLSDICCVDISLSDSIFRLVCTYRPPGVSPDNKLDAILLSSELSKLFLNHANLFVAGDFNLP